MPGVDGDLSERRFGANDVTTPCGHCIVFVHCIIRIQKVILRESRLCSASGLTRA